MRVLVTGATGFVGSKLVRRLIAEGYDVVATYRGDAEPSHSPEVRWLRMQSIGPSSDWTQALVAVEAVIHLAALAHQVGLKGQGRLAEFLAVNAEGTANLAAASVAARTVRRFVFVSSIGAVSSTSDSILNEDTPCRPSTDYGVSKLEGERALARVLGESGIEWCVLRPPLVYGPSNPGNMARLTSLISKQVPLPFGAIKNKRSFIYVDNLVDAIVTCLASRKATRGTYFVTESTDLSTAELSLLLAKHSGMHIRLWRIPMFLLRAGGRAGDLVSKLLGKQIGLDSYSVDRLIGSLCADGSKFRRTFEWTPPFSTEDGIRATCAALIASNSGDLIDERVDRRRTSR